MIKLNKKFLKEEAKELESLKTKQRICDTLAEEEREFYINYTKTVSGTAVIMAKDMKEAQEKFNENDYDMEDDDEDIDWDKIEDSEE